MKIRTGFVSNSSSSSFVVIGNSSYEVPKLDDGFELDGCYQFNWGPERHYDIPSKINWAYIQSKFCEDSRSMLMRVLQECGVQQDYKFHFSTDWDDDVYGYIDHQSMDQLEIFESEPILKQFLFATDSFIVEDNDNH